MRFRYSTKRADGRTCCAGDEPDFPRCPTCKEQELDHEIPNPYRTAMAAAPRVEITLDSDGVPNPYTSKETR